MISATDNLRRLLDERGVERFDGTETTLWGYEPTSESTGAYRFAADETSGGRMQVHMFNITPEQVIAATLGIDRHPYEQRITGDGSDWGEIMRDAYDDLMSAACESCTPDELADLEAYIHGR